MTEAQLLMLNQLEHIRDLRRKMTPPDVGLVYYGMEDFLLQHGVWYEIPPWTGEYLEGAPKQCYGNALLAGIVEGLRYVEGVAGTVHLDSYPLPHAWNIDAEGRLVDTTWRNSGTAYLGVEFSLGRSEDAIWNGDSCILDDWMRKHPLFTEPWKGEDFSRVWPKTGAVRQLRQMEKLYKRKYSARRKGVMA